MLLPGSPLRFVGRRVEVLLDKLLPARQSVAPAHENIMTGRVHYKQLVSKRITPLESANALYSVRKNDNAASFATRSEAEAECFFLEEVARQDPHGDGPQAHLHRFQSRGEGHWPVCTLL